jgi:hypothetical protein
MENNSNNQTNMAASLNENFDVAKMRSLISDDHSQSFSEKFKHWLRAYTHTSKEKIWVDVESYKAW